MSYLDHGKSCTRKDAADIVKVYSGTPSDVHQKSLTVADLGLEMLLSFNETPQECHSIRLSG